MNSAGLTLLKDFEGLAPLAEPGVYRSYWDKIGKVWTGPYGFTEGVDEHSRWTFEEAEIQLAFDVQKYESQVRAYCKVTPNENQLAAMTCLAWNIGLEAFRKSTVLRCHNQGQTEAASRAFGLWNKSKGKEIAGLVRRRAAEAALYLRVNQGFQSGEMPQRVDPESGARSSPIIWGSSIATGGGALSLVSETSRTVGELKYNLGEWFPYILLAAVLIGGGVAIWYRIKQRHEGRA